MGIFTISPSSATGIFANGARLTIKPDFNMFIYTIYVNININNIFDIYLVLYYVIIRYG